MSEEKSLLELAMDIAEMPSKDPFIIIHYSGDLPEGLEPFVSDSFFNKENERKQN